VEQEKGKEKNRERWSQAQSPEGLRTESTSNGRKNGPVPWNREGKTVVVATKDRLDLLRSEGEEREAKRF